MIIYILNQTLELENPPWIVNIKKTLKSLRKKNENFMFDLTHIFDLLTVHKIITTV